MDNSKSIGLGLNKDVKFEVNHNQPTTRINIRLYTGDTITQEFNLTHTISDIRSFISRAAPVQGSFDILSGFPPKALSDEFRSIKDAKLEGTTLTQRLV